MILILVCICIVTDNDFVRFKQCFQTTIMSIYKHRENFNIDYKDQMDPLDHDKDIITLITNNSSYNTNIFINRLLDDCFASNSSEMNKARPILTNRLFATLTGYVSEQYKHEIIKLISYFDIVMIFDRNIGKSTYINHIIDFIRKEQHTVLKNIWNDIDAICTIDGDIITSSDISTNYECNSIDYECNSVDYVRNPGIDLTLFSDLYAVLSICSDVGIVAPNQIGDCRHLSTVYECHRELHLHNDIKNNTTIFWSNLHPSIAGGCWMFRKTIFELKPNGFDYVGEYGPEDVLFAKYAMQILNYKCCLLDYHSVIHPIK